MGNRTKILVVESDPKVALAIANGLMQYGWETLSAGDAIYALNVARQSKPDAIVINSQLAGGGGLVALKRIRSNVHTANIPIIAVTKTDTKPGSRTFVEAGAQECLEQPVDAAMLNAAIRRHLLQSLDFTEAPAEAIAAPQRLATLDETRLLDSAPEACYDRLAKLAAKLIGAPVALMSLVDKDRQFFKSQVGLAMPWSRERQTRLSHSFCQWVVSGKEELRIEDAREHPVLRNNLAIRDLGVIAYAGVPLEHGEQTIGSFCAIDSQPRSWSDDDVATLADLAEVTEAYVTLRELEPSRQLRNQASEARNGACLKACGNAIAALTRILYRHRGNLESTDRQQLLEVIEEQRLQLDRLIGLHSSMS